jgi:hypothetical protein
MTNPTPTALNERYVREWLGGVAASGLVSYHPETATYIVPAEHIPALRRSGGPRNVAQIVVAGGEAAPLIDRVEAEFDDVAALVIGRIKGRRPATDPPPAQQGTDGSTGAIRTQAAMPGPDRLPGAEYVGNVSPRPFPMANHSPTAATRAWDQIPLHQ